MTILVLTYIVYFYISRKKQCSRLNQPNAETDDMSEQREGANNCKEC